MSGSGSDPDGGDSVSFLWSGPVTFSDATLSNPTFTASLVSSGGQTITLTLAVIDDDSFNPKTPVDTVAIHVLNINETPNCDVSNAVCDSSKLGNDGDCILWQPNHNLVEVTVEGLVDPDAMYNNITVDFTGVTQDEPTSGGGGGDTAPDAVIQQGTLHDNVLIRAEQNGSNKNGRVYVVSFEASDGFESCPGSVPVSVPKKKNVLPIDDGQIYDSTQ